MSSVGYFISWKSPGTYFEPQGRTEREQKTPSSPGFEYWNIQPLVSRYTDTATQRVKWYCDNVKIPFYQKMQLLWNT
jgi:hypothetical protein